MRYTCEIPVVMSSV